MNIIKKRRKELKLSQSYLEEKLGISRERIGRLENGDTNMPIGDLKRICEVLEIDWDMHYQINGLTIVEKI